MKAIYILIVIGVLTLYGIESRADRPYVITMCGSCVCQNVDPRDVDALSAACEVLTGKMKEEKSRYHGGPEGNEKCDISSKNVAQDLCGACAALNGWQIDNIVSYTPIENADCGYDEEGRPYTVIGCENAVLLTSPDEQRFYGLDAYANFDQGFFGMTYNVTTHLYTATIDLGTYSCPKEILNLPLPIFDKFYCIEKYSVIPARDFELASDKDKGFTVERLHKICQDMTCKNNKYANQTPASEVSVLPAICPAPKQSLPFTGSTVSSIDPNDKLGLQGAGQQKYISGEEPLPYAVFFENKENATAPAQSVVITDQLDKEKMVLNTFSLALISFGEKQVIPPQNQPTFDTTVDLRPKKDLLVKINTNLDINTGIVTWRFDSIDPVTGKPTEDPLSGFLPPNKNPPEGQGRILFTILPKPGLSTATELRNKADIVFDTNQPIQTPEWFNTIDKSTPESHVLALPVTQSSTGFKVEWSGSDVGSGIKEYTIFVSENGGTYNPWLTNVAGTSGIFTGTFGKTYSFYSVARDLTGNIENAPTGPDATTQLVAAPILGDLNGDGVVTCTDLAIVKASFGKRTSQAGFDVRADVNKDGVVDIRDLSFVSRLLPAGTKCS